MSVTSNQTVAVIYFNQIAVTALPAGFRHGTVCRSDYDVAFFAAEGIFALRFFRLMEIGEEEWTDVMSDIAAVVRPDS